MNRSLYLVPAAVLALTTAACGDAARSPVSPPQPRANLVGNHAPVASAHVQEFGRGEGNSLLFYATGSHDPDNDPLSYVWDFGDGTPNSNGYEVHHTYADNGTYEVTLVVRDGFGAADTSTVSLPISNRPPVVGALNTSGPLVEGRSLTLSTTPATDASADVVAGLLYSFYCGGSSFTTPGPNTSVTCPARPDNGNIAVGVIVIDKDGGVGTNDKAITIANRPPQTVTSSASLVGFRRVQVRYAFTDVPGDILGAGLSLSWGDGTPAVTGRVWAGRTYSFVHTYVHAATYPITITVTDKDGGVTTESIFADVP